MFYLRVLADHDEAVYGVWAQEEHGDIIEAAFQEEVQINYPDCRIISYSHEQLESVLSAYWKCISELELNPIDPQLVESLWFDRIKEL